MHAISSDICNILLNISFFQKALQGYFLRHRGKIMLAMVLHSCDHACNIPAFYGGHLQQCTPAHTWSKCRLSIVVLADTVHHGPSDVNVY